MDRRRALVSGTVAAGLIVLAVCALGVGHGRREQGLKTGEEMRGTETESARPRLEIVSRSLGTEARTDELPESQTAGNRSEEEKTGYGQRGKTIPAAESDSRAAASSSSICKSLSDQISALQKEISELRKALISSGSLTALAPSEEVKRLRMALGLVSIHGPGVEVTIKDNPNPPRQDEDPNLGVVHEEDLLKVVNELYSAGAEAVSINDKRLTVQSRIRCAGPVVMVNEKRIAPPYKVRAIGDQELLYTALTLRGGVVTTLRYFGINVLVEKKKDVILPAAAGFPVYTHSAAVTSNKNGGK